ENSFGAMFETLIRIQRSLENAGVIFIARIKSEAHVFGFARIRLTRTRRKRDGRFETARMPCTKRVYRKTDSSAVSPAHNGSAGMLIGDRCKNAAIGSSRSFTRGHQVLRQRDSYLPTHYLE